MAGEGFTDAQLARIFRDNWETVHEALGDAIAYQTDSGEVGTDELHDYEREAVERYEGLADALGMTLDY